MPHHIASFLARNHLHTIWNQHLWNMLINNPMLAFIPQYAWFLCKSWQSNWVDIDHQQLSLPFQKIPNSTQLPFDGVVGSSCQERAGVVRPPPQIHRLLSDHRLWLADVHARGYTTSSLQHLLVTHSRAPSLWYILSALILCVLNMNLVVLIWWAYLVVSSWFGCL